MANDANGLSATASFTDKVSTSTAVALTAGTNPSLPNVSATFTATVTSATPGSGSLAGGKVNFKDGTNNITGCQNLAVTDSGDNKTATATCTTSFASTGTHNITASYVASGNTYGNSGDSPVLAFVVQAKTGQTITFAPPPSPQGYGATFNVNPTADSGLTVTVTAEAGSVCSVAVDATSGWDVTMTSGSGNCVLDANQAGNSTYNAAQTVKQTVAAKARAITVTADAQTKAYGASDPALTYKVTSGSLVTGDSFSGGLTRDSGENVGQYNITQGTLSAGSNYALTYVGAKLTITAKPVTITPNGGQGKVYGQSDPALTFTNDGGLASGAFTGALGRAPGGHVGSYAITLGTLSAGSNYSLSLSGTVNFAIDPATLSVDAKNAETVYGTAATLDYKLTGFVNSEDATSAGVTGSPSCSVTGSQNVGTHSGAISCSGVVGGCELCLCGRRGCRSEGRSGDAVGGCEERGDGVRDGGDAGLQADRFRE